MAKLKVNQGASAEVVRKRDREVKALLEKQAFSCDPPARRKYHRSAKKDVAKIKATVQVVPVLSADGKVLRKHTAPRSKRPFTLWGALAAALGCSR